MTNTYHEYARGDAPDHADLGAFGHDLEREARLFAARSGNGEEQPPREWLVFDLEFLFDREAHAAYVVREGSEAAKKIRWPFHRVAAVSWLTLRFVKGEPVPEIVGPHVMAADESDEAAMVAALFDALAASPAAIATTWGGEVRDLAVLRRAAATYELVLPPQLTDGWPNSRERLDLCRASCVQADPVHLQELAASMAIPAKPSPGGDIGKLVERGAWRAVREQVLADVLTTSVLAVRYLAVRSLIECYRAETTLAIAEATQKAVPASEFATRTFAPWARAQKAASGLRGAVYRAG